MELHALNLSTCHVLWDTRASDQANRLQHRSVQSRQLHGEGIHWCTTKQEACTVPFGAQGAPSACYIRRQIFCNTGNPSV